MSSRRTHILATAALCLSGTALFAQTAVPPLKVCADPSNLPFSHQNEQGFENKLAQLWASKLGTTVEYTWFPQRRAFLRQTLLASDEGGEYKCDVVMGVPAAFDRGIPTRPIYRSTYAIAFLADGLLSEAQTAQDLIDLPAETKAKARVAAFTPTPGTLWLSRYELDQNLLAFPAMAGDPAEYPGMLIENELVDGEIDAVVLWGPIAGYFAKQVSPDVRVIPLISEEGIKFDFAIAAAVRYGEGERKQQLEKLMDATDKQTQALLAKFGFPLVDEQGKPL